MSEMELTGQAVDVVVPPVDRARRNEAIARASNQLRSRQLADGGWAAPADVGPAATANVAICLDYMGELTNVEAQRVAHWLEPRALADGGFALFAGAGRSDPGATACVAAFLRRHGGAGAQPIAARAEVLVAQHGGDAALVEQVGRGNGSALHLAMAGALPARLLPNLPLWGITLPAVEGWLLGRFHGGILMTAYASRLLTRALLGERRGLTRRLLAPLDSRETERGIHWLSSFQNPSGSWNEWATVTALNVAALHAAGLPASDDRVRRALDYLKRSRSEHAEGISWMQFSTGFWATLFASQALDACGDDDAANDDAILKAGDFVLRSQCRYPQAAANHVFSNGPLTGGFAFHAENTVLPDCDDTGAALSTLAMLRSRTRDQRPNRQHIERAIADAQAWLLGMQNRDGGFASYVCGLPGKRRGPLYTRAVSIDPRRIANLVRLGVRPPLELGDPSTEDVTGRCLHGLGKVGLRLGHPAIDAALAFLRAQQLDDGSFWGRWLTNYLSGTAYVVRGALAVGVSVEQPWLQRAVAFLVRMQRSDGAWGESIESYADPERHKGRGGANAAITGRVLCALLEADACTTAIARGLTWLVENQRDDGSWDGSNHLAVIYPPDTFYVHEPAGTYYPLWALALARRAGL
jgi:squalene-hopene/tetraprenyl-beta-curcumene cyclase